jgi:tagatose 6-phosphate kinase
VVCPNLAIDRILEVDHFHAEKVQRSRSVLTQPGGKGSNVARVFRQLGGDVVLLGFAGRANADLIRKPLRDSGIHVDVIGGYAGDTRVCTIVCDPVSRSHPTVINEESPEIKAGGGDVLLNKVRRWLPRVSAVLAIGSLATGLRKDFYAEVLELARSRGKITAIDASGDVLRRGLSAKPTFAKANAEEFRELTRRSKISSLFTLALHTVLTLGKAGAVLMHESRYIYAPPPAVFDVNPIGAGDAFAAGYLKGLLDGRPAAECLRLAMAAAAADCATLRPGFVDPAQVERLL